MSLPHCHLCVSIVCISSSCLVFFVFYILLILRLFSYLTPNDRDNQSTTKLDETFHLLYRNLNLSTAVKLFVHPQHFLFYFVILLVTLLPAFVFPVLIASSSLISFTCVVSSCLHPAFFHRSGRPVFVPSLSWRSVRSFVVVTRLGKLLKSAFVHYLHWVTDSFQGSHDVMWIWLRFYISRYFMNNVQTVFIFWASSSRVSLGLNSGSSLWYYNRLGQTFVCSGVWLSETRSLWPGSEIHNRNAQSTSDNKQSGSAARSRKRCTAPGYGKFSWTLYSSRYRRPKPGRDLDRCCFYSHKETLLISGFSVGTVQRYYTSTEQTDGRAHRLEMKLEG